VGVQEIMWGKGGMLREWDFNFPMEKVKKIMNWKQDFCTQHNNIGS
jgi:hypothetical protein